MSNPRITKIDLFNPNTKRAETPEGGTPQSWQLLGNMVTNLYLYFYMDKGLRDKGPLVLTPQPDNKNEMMVILTPYLVADFPPDTPLEKAAAYTNEDLLKMMQAYAEELAEFIDRPSLSIDKNDQDSTLCLTFCNPHEVFCGLKALMRYRNIQTADQIILIDPEAPKSEIRPAFLRAAAEGAKLRTSKNPQDFVNYMTNMPPGSYFDIAELDCAVALAMSVPYPLNLNEVEATIRRETKMFMPEKLKDYSLQ